jgi:hypothetical protein
LEETFVLNTQSRGKQFQHVFRGLGVFVTGCGNDFLKIQNSLEGTEGFDPQTTTVSAKGSVYRRKLFTFVGLGTVFAEKGTETPAEFLSNAFEGGQGIALEHDEFARVLGGKSRVQVAQAFDQKAQPAWPEIFIILAEDSWVQNVKGDYGGDLFVQTCSGQGGVVMQTEGLSEPNYAGTHLNTKKLRGNFSGIFQ